MRPSGGGIRGRHQAHQPGTDICQADIPLVERMRNRQWTLPVGLIALPLWRLYKLSPARDDIERSIGGARATVVSHPRQTGNRDAAAQVGKKPPPPALGQPPLRAEP